MSHTTEEVKNLWCPMARMDGVNGSYNRETVASHEHPTCIADDCAAWRWTPTGETNMAEKVVTDGGYSRIIHVRVPTAPTHGCCGLAGRPEVV